MPTLARPQPARVDCRRPGQEARGLHNGFLASDPDGRQMGCNGCSLTMYAPNLNLVRDPRWGRAQEVY